MNELLCPQSGSTAQIHNKPVVDSVLPQDLQQFGAGLLCEVAKPGVVNVCKVPPVAFHGQLDIMMLGMKMKTLAAAGLILLCVLVYFNSLHGEFQYDDERLIRFNVWLRDPAQWKQLLLSEPFRPALVASLALNFHAGRDDPFSYHAVSLALHTLTTVLLFLLLKRSSIGVLYSFLAAALFAVHPVNTEAVSYIASRSILLCALFSLLSLLALDSYLRKGRRVHLIFFVLSFLAAVLSREEGWILPFAALCYNGAFFGWDSIRKHRWIHLISCSLTLAGGFFRLYIALTVAPAGGIPYSQYLPTEMEVCLRYLTLCVFPVPLTVEHQIAPLSWLSFRVWVAGMVVAGTMVLMFRMRKTRPFCAFWGAWFFWFLIPSSLFPLNEFMAEHRAYMSVLGFCACFGYLPVLFENREGGKISRMVVAGMIGCILAFAFGSIVRNRVWSDSRLLWMDAAAKSPGQLRPHVNLAYALMKNGQYKQAMDEFEKAMYLNPNHASVQSGIGFLYLAENDLQRADRSFRHAMELNPGFVDAATGLGMVLYRSGKYADALRYFRTAFPYRQNSTQLVAMMADCAFQTGEDQQTIDLLQRGIRLDPSQPFWYSRMKEARKRLAKAPR